MVAGAEGAAVRTYALMGAAAAVTLALLLQLVTARHQLRTLDEDMTAKPMVMGDR